MTVLGIDLRFPHKDHESYDITFFDEPIGATVTSTPSVVGEWINSLNIIRSIEQNRSIHSSIIGLRVEWRPSFTDTETRVAVLQLCVGHACLVYQLLHSSSIPQSLKDFLADPDITFVGVGIDADAQMLENSYGLEVCNTVDLRGLAATVLGESELEIAGLYDLGRVVLGKEIEKPSCVSLSDWDSKSLTDSQIKYATVDAFLSCEIGNTLIFGELE